jgi:hypothetical protein
MSFSENPKCRLCGLAEDAAWNIKLYVNVNQAISIVWYYWYYSGAQNCLVLLVLQWCTKFHQQELRVDF